MKKEEAIALIDKLHEELASIANSTQRSDDTDTGFEKLKRWKSRAVTQITESINSLEGDRLKSKKKMSFQMGDPIGNLIDEAQMYEGFLFALKDEIENHADDVLKRPIVADALTESKKEVDMPKGNGIFIVHGHDELNLLRLKEMLRERYDLDVIVLGTKPGRGRTIIEKFEEEAQQATYAFVLLTPDDIIQKTEEEYSQARPNVIFELGWFYGRLGRESVSILYKEGTKIHSDLDGVSRIEFKDNVIEKVDEIERELLDAKVLQPKV